MIRLIIYALALRGAYDVWEFLHALGPICVSIGGGCQ